MKIMTKKDFKELNRRLTWIEAHFQVTIDSLEEYANFHCDDEELKNILLNHVEWARKIDGPDELKSIRDEIMDRGIYNKGLRY